MDRLVLCTEPFLAELVLEEGRVQLRMSGQGEMVIPLQCSHVRAMLEGDTIQVSGKGGHCRMERRGDRLVAYCHWNEESCRVDIAVDGVQEMLERCLSAP